MSENENMNPEAEVPTEGSEAPVEAPTEAPVEEGFPSTTEEDVIPSETEGETQM